MTNGLLKEEEAEFRRFYKLSLWWVEHRALVIKAGYGLFMAADGALLAFVLWTMADAFLISADRERLAVAGMAVYGQQERHAHTLDRAARPIEAGPASVIALGEGTYDFYSPLENPNADWYAEFTYRFRSSAGETDEARGFILPGQTKPAAAFAAVSGTAPRSAAVELGDVEWRRVDHHVVGDYAAWSADRLDFGIRDVQFTSEVLLDTKPIGRVAFTVTNNTAFSYYDPGFYILLVRGTSVVGVNRTTLSSLDSGETQQVAVNWFGTLPSVSRVEVVPDINLFDLNVYKPLAGETSTDTRSRVFPPRR